MWRRLLPITILILIFAFFARPLRAQESALSSYTIRPGDSWTALAVRTNISERDLLDSQRLINPQRQPVIGQKLHLPLNEQNMGRLLRPFAGGLLQIAAQTRQSPWKLALLNEQADPYQPLLYAPLFIPDATSTPQELPYGFSSLTLSPLSARPGQALLLWADMQEEEDVQIGLDNTSWIVNRNGRRLLALTATGAFFKPHEVLLSIESDGRPLWSQPWEFQDRDWNYEQIDFKAMPATDPEIMRAEREYLQEIWSAVTPAPQWQGSFQMPITDYVELTSHYGARRSVNGGAYDTYHEGTDYSAFGGTPVTAPAAGVVAVAEPLIVRGGTVILDHGLGIHSGFYHLSAIAVEPGQTVQKGELIGQVGTTGRSTGNHLHWDMLIGTTWIDSETWMDENFAQKIQLAWGAEFQSPDYDDMPK